MDNGFLTAAFGAVASCVAVHIGFGVFGLEPVLEAAGQAVGAALGIA